MKHMTILVKPVSQQCNLRCRYCFYHDVSAQQARAKPPRMSHATAETLISEALSAVEPGGSLHFDFQGGEPTLAGLDFYRHVLAAEARMTAGRPVQIGHSIQTNGLLLDETWCRFLGENRFLVGLSLDGTRELHDFCRVDAQGKGTWKGGLRALSLLKRHGVQVNLLCVVTAQCARSPMKVYQSLKKLNGYLQFIPCLDPLQAPRGGQPYSLKPEAYGAFLCRLFDLWYRDWEAGDYTSIRLFDDYVHLMAGMGTATCAVTGQCGGYLVCESDGSLYPCDFFAAEPWRLGAVGERPLAAMFQCAAGKIAAEDALPPGCAGCRWLALCRGGCKRDRWTGQACGENYYCGALRQFFSYAEARLSEMARAELRMLGGALFPASSAI